MRKFYWIAALTVIVDQIVKWACLTLTGSVTLIPHVLALTYAENTGMAFSLFSGRAWALGVVSALCILAGWLVLRRYKLGRLSRVAAMLMLGGAAGNMLDRFFRGYVVDMFEVLFMEFAIFNVADAALTVGTALMAASLLLRPEEWQEKPAN
ncbi:MAG: signal peptidase II [Clostridiales bacterium]|nr:signal peptidase II [Clostridiales bacterium]